VKEVVSQLPFSPRLFGLVCLYDKFAPFQNKVRTLKEKNVLLTLNLMSIRLSVGNPLEDDSGSMAGVQLTRQTWLLAVGGIVLPLLIPLTQVTHSS
jgi:hypothetical protein